MSGQNKSMFSFPFEGIVWKLLVNFQHQVLLLEIRMEETRKVKFVAIGLLEKKILWEQDRLPETWWVSLFETNQDKLVIHGYRDLQNPVHQKIYVLDLFTGKLLWKSEEFKALKLLHNELIAAMEGSESLLLLDSSSGRKIGEMSLETYKRLDLSELSPGDFIKTPLKYSTENQYFIRLASFIETVTGKVPEKLVEYLEHNSKIIVSFYSTLEEKLVNYIMISDEEGNLIFNDVIAEGLSTIAMESFFLWKDQLIFIKNRKELVIFEL